MSPDNDIFDQIRLFLPKYLTEQQSRTLFSELGRFPSNYQFYTFRSDLQNELLQGDGWRGFVAIDFYSGAKKEVSGVVLSNSCDVSSENERTLPVNILFAPLIELQKYEASLLASGKSESQVSQTLSTIRKQYVSSIFYLPTCSNLIQESIIVLDDIHAHPLQDFFARDRASLFTLNQYAFYVFLIKLSIHFSRFGEGVQRFDNAA